MLNEQQQKEFEALARPLIKFLCDNCHPQMIVIVSPTNAELLEGVCSMGEILDYLRD